jgi:hypothetical protein
MSVLLITYDSNIAEQNCEKILELIKSSTAWAKLSEYSYAVKTDETPQDLYAKFAPFLSENTRFFIINLTRPFAGIKNTAVLEWLEKTLPV